MGFDDAEFVLLYLARKMDSNDRYLPAARALVERCGATGTIASRLSPGVTARDIGARSSHREVKVGPLSPQHRRVHPHYGPLPRALPLCLPPTRRVHANPRHNRHNRTSGARHSSNAWGHSAASSLCPRHGHCTTPVLPPCEEPLTWRRPTWGRGERGKEDERHGELGQGAVNNAKRAHIATVCVSVGVAFTACHCRIHAVTLTPLPSRSLSLLEGRRPRCHQVYEGCPCRVRVSVTIRGLRKGYFQGYGQG